MHFCFSFSIKWILKYANALTKKVSYQHGFWFLFLFSFEEPLIFNFVTNLLRLVLFMTNNE